MKISATAYALRENPKKSLRISDDSCSTNATLSNIICKICGKGFSTSRQLCGHLRHHTIAERLGREVVACKECGKRFKSIRSLCGHMKSHSSVVCHGIGTIRAGADVIDCSLLLIPNAAGVRKRARTPRFEVSRKRPHFENGEESSSALEEEVAASLIMLSQGLEFSNAALDVGIDGCCNVELVDQGLRSDGFQLGKSLGVEITASDSCEKIYSEINLDVCQNLGESKNAEFDAFDTSRVKTEGLVGQIEMGGVYTGNSDIVKPEDGIHGVSSTGPLRYRCISCDKNFSSHQALGGHNSSKHRWRCSKTTYPVGDGVSKKPECADGDEKRDELCAVGVPVPHCELLKSCDHKCALCFKVFGSAQALGGHMGAHVAERTMIDQTKQPRSKLTWCTSALSIENCHTIQADNVAEGTGDGENPKTTVDDAKKDETCSVSIAHFEILKKCKHKCPLCFKIFRSAQTLGAHMGAHVAESSVEPCQVQQPGSAVPELSMISKSPLASWKMVVS